MRVKSRIQLHKSIILSNVVYVCLIYPLKSVSMWMWMLTSVWKILSDKAVSIWESKDFFMELDPLPGGVEAVKEMSKMENTDVFICTSPIKHYSYCPYEKYAWVEKHLGPNFLEQIILTRDKTIVTGDVLIDDKPDILGVEPNPTWEHILFSACHNKHLPLNPSQRRLLSWSDDWREMLASKRQ
ncbi:5'(3')-deoxyribonucleotidase, mitochondrial isoform X2 [Misgurnus anguillicaudatus]|uniref:5'(3')-deoxyribonucleotidase, mitochondrial isoform X2 n=1 Tax=Misgurnus anguillicaudatus TaxID=75329 RepID=UPI003CCF9B96